MQDSNTTGRSLKSLSGLGWISPRLGRFLLGDGSLNLMAPFNLNYFFSGSTKIVVSEPRIDDKNECNMEDPFYCEVKGQGACIHQSQTCNGISECTNGKDETVEICGKLQLICNSIDLC